MKKLWMLALLILIPACGGGGSSGGGGIAGTTVQFQIPRGGTMPDFFALPFPTDLRLKADGTLDLTGFPPGPRPDVLRGYISTIESDTHGWGTNGAAYFRFASAIDPNSLPADPNASTQSDATVFIMDIDPASPQRGMRTPVQLRYYAQATVFIPERVLAVLPVPGIPLRGQTRYAAVITRAVKDAAGKALGSPATLEDLKKKQASADPDVETARGIYEPAFAELESHGVKREDIASIAVFTTQDATGEMVRIRQFIHASVAQPEAQGVSCVAESLYIRCTGEYSSPNFQAGTAPYQSAGGNLVFDASGNPQVQRTETLAFTLTLPKGTAVPASGFPITLAAHGTGGSRNSILGTNDTGDVLARRGIAVIGIDQPLQGLRDDFCPAATRDQCESLWTFNPANIRAARDNFRQGSLDNFQLVRLVKSLTIPAATAGTSSDVHFDPARIFFFGHSQGGITGPAFLAIEPDVKGGVLSGSGGNLAIGLLLKTEPTDIKGTIEFLLGIEGQNELDIFHPIMAAVQTFVERADPLNYARAWATEPLPGNAPKHVLLTEGIGDNYTPNGTAEALGVASGGNPVNPVLVAVDAFSLSGRSPLDPPVSGNVSGPSGGTSTIVLAQYTPPSGTDGHFVVYYNSTARRQYGDFLGTLADNGAATFQP